MANFSAVLADYIKWNNRHGKAKQIKADTKYKIKNY